MRILDHPTWSGCVAVAIVATGMLAVHSRYYDPGRLHINGQWTLLVDQVYYTTTAKTLVDSGELRSSVIMPALIPGGSQRVYMPGYFCALAAFYGLFGFGDVQSLLPSLAGYLLSAVLTYWIGRRLAGPAVGLIASFLFIVFPGNFFYAFTAMSELSITAACLAAFSIHLLVPPRFRNLATPVLLIIPFLFRETSSLLVLPMLAAGFRRDDARRWVKLLATGAASVVTLWLVQQWQYATGLIQFKVVPSTQFTFNYGDATAPPPAGGTFSDWAAKWQANLGELMQLLTTRVASPEGVAAVMIIAFTAVAITTGIARRRTTLLPLAYGLLGLGSIAIIVGLYEVPGYKFTRVAMYTFPFLALAVAPVIGRWIELENARLRWKVAGILAAALVAGSIMTSRVAGPQVVMGDDRAEQDNAFLDTLNHPQGTVLAAPYWIAFDYTHRRYPLVYSFLPDNDPSLLILCKAYNVGTLVVPEAMLGDRLTTQAIESQGFEFRGRKVLRSDAFMVFQHAAANATTP